MSNSETYKNYLRDLIFILKEKYHTQKSNNEFEAGLKTQLQHILDLIESQAYAFQIELNEIGFYDFDKHDNNIGKSE